jgi:hypothetical protein
LAPAAYWTANPGQRLRVEVAIAVVKTEEVWADLAPILQEDIEAFLDRPPAQLQEGDPPEGID